MQKIAIVGAGLIGKSWAIVFARSGRPVRVFDSNPDRLGDIKQEIAEDLKALQDYDLVENAKDILARITVCDSLEAAVDAVDYVQESVLETVDLKKAVCAQIDKLIGDAVIVGSSSSGIPASAFTENLKNRNRFFIVHPTNPPHLIPLVEIVPAPWSDKSLIPGLRNFLEAVGQQPIVVNKEIEGFILNRLQGALLNEAWALFEDGYASTSDIDLTISRGLGMRWSFMGPFETIDLNSPGGIEDYAGRLSPLYHSIAKSREGARRWSPEAIKKASSERREELKIEALKDRQQWRDRQLIKMKGSIE
jgi:3-hydroxyacyl-CoA dehydrogenase